MNAKLETTEPTFIKNLRDFIIEVVKAELFNQREMLESVKNESEWLTTKEAENYLKVSHPTLWDMVKRGEIPKYYLDGKPRYNMIDLKGAFIKLQSKKGNGGNYE